MPFARTITATFFTATLLLTTAGTALANPEAPTNGGSANGGGSSGQCTGANADRPAACHNGQGSGN